MKAMRATHESCDLSAFDDTEFALAISPCPQINGANDAPENTLGAGERSEYERMYQAFPLEEELTETLTIGWGIALAMAVALVVYASGG
jgi:hypothetical protein